MDTRLFVGTGLWLALVLTPGPAGAGELSPSEEGRLRDAPQGGVVYFPEDDPGSKSWPRVPITISPQPGPQLLLSDQPEYFLTGDGIALQEEVRPGRVRLYLYHVPEPTGAKKTISAVLENLGTAPLHFRLLRRGCPPPGGDYSGIAREAVVNFLTSPSESQWHPVEPGRCQPLDATLERASATRNQLVHGFFEFEVDQPARISVLQRGTNLASSDALGQLARLPRRLPGSEHGNGAGRGLFPNADLAVTNGPGFVLDTTNGPMQLILADGRTDAWIRGRDGIEHGVEVQNVGNYGVFYHVRLTRRSSDGRALALLLRQLYSPQRGCGPLATAVRVSDGVWPGGVVSLPGALQGETPSAAQGKPGSRSKPGPQALRQAGELAVIQKFPPVPKGQVQTIDLLYTPPGAACLPTPLVLVPYRL